MKTCTFKKALSLLIAVMMVISCVTVLSVGAAAAVTWDGFKDATALYNQFVKEAEWIPVGQTSGNGRYEDETADNQAAFIYAFGQDSTKIFAFIEIANPSEDKKVTLRLDSNRDTVTARSHELVFEQQADGSWKQTNTEYGVDVDVANSVTNGKFANGKVADFAGTSFMKGNSYEFDVIDVTKEYNGTEKTGRNAKLLVVQLRKDRLQGNTGSGNFDYVSALGFDIELQTVNYGTVHSSNSADAANDATNFNIYSAKEDRVVRFELDGKITGNEFWKDNQWQLVTGINGQIEGDFVQTDIAYDFQVTGDTKNVYIAVRLYGDSYKDGDNASSFKVYINTDRESAKKAGYEPNAVLEFVFNGSKYEFVNNNSEFTHLETETTVATDGHAEIEIKIPYRDIRLSSWDIVENPYNYIGFNFEFTAPAVYSDEQNLISLVARTYGDEIDHPAYNCEESTYFTFRSNYADYQNYAVDKYNTLDYNGNLAYEGGEIDNFNDIDAYINELSDDYKANNQVVVHRVSDALKTGNWTNGKPGQDDHRPDSFLSAYFDYLVYSDGTTLYAMDKGYVPVMGRPELANDYNSQNSGNHVRFWFSTDDYWNNGANKFAIIDSGVNVAKDGNNNYNNATDMYAWAHGSFSAIGGDPATIENAYSLQKDTFTTAIKVPVAQLHLNSDNLYYVVTNSFFTKTTTSNNVISVDPSSRVQISSGRYIGGPNAGYTVSNVAYRVINAKTPAKKLARVAYTADEALKKNILADVYYEAEGIGSYVDTVIDPALAELKGIAMRGRLNDGIYDNGAIDSKDPKKNFSVALANHIGADKLPAIMSADAANTISFQLQRNYGIAGFKAVFRRLVSWGIKNPNYVDVYVTNAAGDTQHVGRFYGVPSSDDSLVEYDIVLNKAVVGNKVTFEFDSEGTFIFATEFQAYSYGDLVATTTGTGYDPYLKNDGGYGTAMLYGVNSNPTGVRAWWTTPVFKFDTNLGAYYVVSKTMPNAHGTFDLNYKTGDFAIAIHSNAKSGEKATAATKANYDMLNSLQVGERVYLYNNAHADANYDLMMQPTGANNKDFFITIGNELMSKDMTAYNPSVGYQYSLTDLGQIGDGKSTMILIDSQSKPHTTKFSKDDLPIDSFLVGELLNSDINLWNYYVAIVEYDAATKTYYVADYKPAISRPANTTDKKWDELRNDNNKLKRNLSFTTQGFAILSLNNGEMTTRLSRMWANDYNLGINKANSKAPDTVYIYNVDLDALRLSYGNAGALNAKVTFNNKNGKDNATKTESWVDLAESSLSDLTDRWLGDLESMRSQLSEKAYEQLKLQITNNIKYCRAYALFANKFNYHEYTAGLRANPWVLYDNETKVENLSFDENIFALWNRNSQWSVGATQTAGIMLMNTNKNYEEETEFSGFNKNFAALHDNNYTSLNYLNKITYTFYYDFANGYAVPETLRIYTSANYSFMNHTKPYEVSIKDKTSDDGKAYPTTGTGTWTITVDMPLTTATAIYTEFDFTSKQLGVVEINEKCVITDLMTSEINSVKVDSDSCVVTINNVKYPAVTSTIKDGVVTINHDHSKHGTVTNHTCTKECYVKVSNAFYGNTFIDLNTTPYLHLVMDVPTNLSATSLTMNVWYNGVSRRIALDNIIAREVSNGKIDYFFDFADFCKNTYGMDLKDGKLLQLENWVFETKFADSKTSAIKINKFEFIPASGVVADLVAGSDIELNAEKKLLILDQQYKEEALRQQFTGAITVEGTAKNGFVGTGAKVTVNGTVYTVVLYGDLNGDGAISPADYIMIRRAILKTLELDDIQQIAAIGPKASKITATTYIQIRQHVLGTYNFFKGEKIAQ